MWLEIDVVHKFARADARTIDHQPELLIDVFELLEADIRVDFAASFAKTRGEIIQVNRRVHERYAQRETTLKRFKRCLDFARHDRRQARDDSLRAEWNCPIRNLNFARAQKLAQLDY